MRAKKNLVLVVAALAFGCGDSRPDYRRTASTVIIAWPEGLGAPERPLAEFDHLKHTDQLRAEGCETCHSSNEKTGKIIPALKAKIDCGDKNSCVESWHHLCVDCHAERVAQQKKGGPTDCGLCHRELPPGLPPRARMAFDYSLHQRHSDTLQKEMADQQQKACSSCHHLYDEKLKKLYYQPDRETACFDCHLELSTESVISWRQAAHVDCLNCHLRRQEKNQPGGPTECQGCHDRKMQLQIKRLKNEIRLFRKQDDRMWVQTEKTPAALVPFDHKAHENRADFCTTCHHRALKPCGSCHDLEGRSRDSGGLSLVMAHHDRQSTISCIGCHRTSSLLGRECSGCHSQLVGPPSPSSCAACHRGPLPEAAVKLPPGEMFAKAAVQVLPQVSEKDFPAKLVLESGGNLFRPTEFPHQKIVEKLFTQMDKSPRAEMARFFHGRLEVFCSGCHHHQPVGDRPASCRSCHGAEGEKTVDRPALREAYHRRCIGCHLAMDLKQGCDDCHKREPGKESRP